MSWVLQPSEFFFRRKEALEKNHAEAVKATLENLDTYHKALCSGLNPVNIKMGFIHPEREGIVAIDQKGGRGKLIQTRLYVFPDTGTKILHIISIGTKVDQNKYIQECREYIRPLKKTGGDDYGKKV